MEFGGWQKVTLVDYPDKIATVVFTNGCLFKCQFCYNNDLVSAPFPIKIPEATILAYLKKRQGKIDAIVITGGEPTIHQDLSDFISKVKALGYLVKLDTNGYMPKNLQKVLSDTPVDYLAMDIKAPLDKYSALAGINVQTDKIKQSIDIIINSGIPHEFRTTIIKEDHTVEDVAAMAQLIENADKYFLQPFQATDTLVNPAYKAKTSPTPDLLKAMQTAAQKHINACYIRSS
jgi:pyruvate formate lyase activating enzyme